VRNQKVSRDRRFFDPITVTGQKPLMTLRDAALYITKLSKAEHDAEEWQAAMEALLLVAEHDGPEMFARIGVMRRYDGLSRTQHVRHAGRASKATDRSIIVKSEPPDFLRGPNLPARGAHIRPRRQSALMSSRQPPLSIYGRIPALQE
jgi:hypothetical protein